MKGHDDLKLPPLCVWERMERPDHGCDSHFSHLHEKTACYAERGDRKDIYDANEKLHVHSSCE